MTLFSSRLSLQSIYRDHRADRMLEMGPTWQAFHYLLVSVLSFSESEMRSLCLTSLGLRSMAPRLVMLADAGMLARMSKWPGSVAICLIPDIPPEEIWALGLLNPA